ncbi:MAG: hypothetical protein ACRDXX_07440, partial [Stackebrandtia sp.]
PPRQVLARRRAQRVFVNGVGAIARGVADLLREAEIGRVWRADDCRRGKATFTVLVNTVQPPTLTARAHARRKLPYLPVTAADGGVDIGPLVRPGSTPCLRCVEMHCKDAAPNWRGRAGECGSELVETTLRQLAIAMTAALAVQHLDGDASDAVGHTFQLRSPLRLTRRRWKPHPRCGCTAG